MNGTAVMTALACLAYVRAEYLFAAGTRITALASFALNGNADHFDAEAVFGQTACRSAIRSRAGCVKICNWHPRRMANGCRTAIQFAARPMSSAYLPMPCRGCASHIENELNSANDNPIIDAEGERVFTAAIFTAVISPSPWTA